MAGERHLTGKRRKRGKFHILRSTKVSWELSKKPLMLGSDKSCGYCLEMICADFLAGANFRTPDMVNRKSVRFLLADEREQPNNACAAECPGTACLSCLASHKGLENSRP